jgi:hypothetical protein
MQSGNGKPRFEPALGFSDILGNEAVLSHFPFILSARMRRPYSRNASCGKSSSGGQQQPSSVTYNGSSVRNGASSLGAGKILSSAW